MAPRPVVAHPQRSVRAPDLHAIEVRSQSHSHLNLTMVAEGIKTEAELQFLREQGCAEAQGWDFSPALSAGDFVKWFTAIS